MLIKEKKLEGFKLDSLDGEIGKVKDFYFDDRHWIIRYVAADTGNWLTGRQVLISPYALLAVNLEEGNIGVDLTKKQIENSPPLERHKPVSHQYEQAYYGYYSYPAYWGGMNGWGEYSYLQRNRALWNPPAEEGKKWDPNLRCAANVSGNHIGALDGDVGHVKDFIIDDQTWAIRYIIVDTHNWWPGKQVLVAPQWIKRVSWLERKVFVNLSREAIKRSPEYTEDLLLTREYEIGLHGHYNQKGYWIDELAEHEQSH